MMLGPSIVSGCPQQKRGVNPKPTAGRSESPRAALADIGRRPEKNPATLPAYYQSGEKDQLIHALREYPPGSAEVKRLAVPTPHRRARRANSA